MQVLLRFESHLLHQNIEGFDQSPVFQNAPQYVAFACVSLCDTRHLLYVSLSDTLRTVIKSFRHDGLERFFRKGSKAGIQPNHAKKLKLQLLRLDGATGALDMNLPGWDWHSLKNDLDGHSSVSVNGNWRLTFTFEGTDAILVDYQDYH
jgi:proteic killer suppression protein